MVVNSLSPDELAWCRAALASFHFIAWDRFIWTRLASGPVMLTCYGWMDREKDSYKDFAVIDLIPSERRINFVTSSSAKWSPEIGRLSGFPPDMTKRCIRLQTLFDIPNLIRLKEEPKE